MKKKWLVVALICSGTLIGCSTVGAIMSDVEKPDYKIISEVQSIEIREYKPMIIAEVEVKGKREEAIGDGFRLLADYIFGNNTVSQDIKMTAPVQQQETNQKIAMTAPVQQQQLDDQSSWRISFVMPSEYTLDTLPLPANDKVQLKEMDGQKFVVIKFSGTSSKENLLKHESLLTQHVKENHLKTTGPLKYAFYNPPWTLPFMRRNEIMIELTE